MNYTKEFDVSLKTSIIGKNSGIVHLDEAGSTNDAAKELAMSGVADGTVVVADTQTSGRGRFGRLWESRKGAGIYMSIILRPDIEPAAAPRFTMAAAVAVCRALKDVTTTAPQIKWPNDIILGKKKVCGILTEANTAAGGAGAQGRVNFLVCGIGVNVLHTEAELLPNATSLYLDTGVLYDRAEVLAAILNRLDEIYLEQFYLDERMIHEYKCLCLNIGHEINVAGKEDITGIALDIASDGGLILKTPSGLVTVNSGEATVKYYY